MNYSESSSQHEELMTETSTKAKRPYGFVTNKWCVFAGHKYDEDGNLHMADMEIRKRVGPRFSFK